MWATSTWQSVFVKECEERELLHGTIMMLCMCLLLPITFADCGLHLEIVEVN